MTEMTLKDDKIKGSPLVSILMTAYNREKYIADSIESILASAYENFELIIVDDCSQDMTVEIAKRFALKDQRVQVYVNKSNLGDYPNRNMAASYARGKYLKYVDSDDFLYPFGLAIMVSRMESHPSAIVGLAKRGLKEKPYPLLLRPQESYWLNFIAEMGVFANAPTSSIILRENFISSGSFSGQNQYGDYEYWLKAAAKGDILLIEGDVTWDRDHSSSEKYKDDKYTKHILHHKITIEALESDSCPLKIEDKRTALKTVRKRYKRLILKTVLHFKIGKAILLFKSFKA
jgi:glycosyltransferase involved in cell wall biosynthesis